MILIEDSILSFDECESLIEMGSANLIKAKTLGEEIDGYRTAEMSWLREDTELVSKVKQIVSDYTKLPIENQESPHFIKYEVGGEYKQHHDFFHKDTDYYEDNMKKGGQRVYSCIFYLTDNYIGGETLFPTKQIAVTPKVGRLLIWKNLLPNGEVDNDSIHAGLPVLQGVKKILIIWVRENEFKLN